MTDLLWLESLKNNLKRQGSLLADATKDLKPNSSNYIRLRTACDITARAIESINLKIEKYHRDNKPKFISKEMIENNLYVEEFPKRIEIDD